MSRTQLEAIASVPETFVYTPSAGIRLGEGTQTLSVLFIPTDSIAYNKASADVLINVNNATPTIIWKKPADITHGTALTATQLDATASVTGTFVYTPPVGTVLNAGTQTLKFLLHQLTLQTIIHISDCFN